MVTCNFNSPCFLDKIKHYSDLIKREGTSPVVIYGKNDEDMLISMLACLFAHRPYVPVDSSVPIQRVKNIINSTKSKLTITNQNTFPEAVFLKDLEKYKDFPVLESGDNRAYIIFTSGSTGEPKGVEITRDNLKNFVGWLNTLSPLCEYKDITVLNQASFGFDLSVADVFYAFSNRHKLLIMDREAIFESVSKVHVMFVTPTFMRLLLINPDFNRENYPLLRCVYFCGESLSPSLVKTLFSRFGDIRILNAYGPTEATSAVSASEIREDMLNAPLLPAGDVNNFATTLEIIKGEIVLSGKSVFSGYLGSEKIKRYHTGDVGFIKDGHLYIEGRRDSQIKYKGYRVELFDIENNIQKISTVKECAVIAKRFADGSVKMIVAYAVLENATAQEVCEELRKMLPQYMIPKIVQVESLPTTSNGKTDRKKLAEI